MAIALNPGVLGGVSGVLPAPAAVCEFSDSFVPVPALGGLNYSGWYPAYYVQIFGVVYDDRYGSPTEYLLISWSQYEPAQENDATPFTQNFTTPTLRLSVNSGLRKHRLCAFTNLPPVVYAAETFELPYVGSGGLASTGLVYFYGPQTYYQQTVLLGSLKGTVTCWLGGQIVGKIPFNIFNPVAGQSSVSMIFDVSLGAGAISALKGGSLNVRAPFDNATRQIPSIEFVGACDQVTIDFSLTGAFCGAGGLYAGIYSYA